MPIPASRDRLSRPVDISTLLNQLARRVNLIVDEPGLRRVGLTGYGFRNTSGNGSTRGGGLVGSPVGVHRAINGQGRNQQRAVVPRTPGTIATRRGGRGMLPSWHPRTPLKDITDIVRAMESRRAELGLNHDREAPQEENNDEFGNNDALTLIPTIAVKPHLSSDTQLWRIKSGNDDSAVDGSDFLTPQKKLLNSIETVRKVWLENQGKLERTPAAKRVERENKVRVLMSMR